MLLSIIIPIYNREITIKDLLDTILPVQSQDFEVILVDDGSTDKSLAICKEYEMRDSRCMTICKKNNGVSSARNTGIKNAKGKYVWFCDSDDRINTSEFLKIIKELSEYDEDCIVFDFIYDYIDKGIKRKSGFQLPQNKVLNREEITNYILSSLILKVGTDLASVWHKFFKRDLILKQNILFDEKVNKGEDWRFVVDFLSKSNSLIYKPYMIYEYRLESTLTDAKYKYFPGEHLLGSVERKINISRERNLYVSRKLYTQWYKTQIDWFIFSVKSNLERDELKKMRKNFTLIEAINLFIKMKGKEYRNFEISRKYKLYALCIKFRFYKLLKK